MKRFLIILFMIWPSIVFAGDLEKYQMQQNVDIFQRRLSGVRDLYYQVKADILKKSYAPASDPHIKPSAIAKTERGAMNDKKSTSNQIPVKSSRDFKTMAARLDEIGKQIERARSERNTELLFDCEHSLLDMKDELMSYTEK
jgi:hypothetical protein